MKQNRSVAMWSLVLALFLLPLQSAWATTYYVDSRSGSDANDGKSAARAWKSLHAVNARVKGVGDDVLFSAGSVFEDQRLIIRWGGTEQDWVDTGCYRVSATGTVGQCTSPLEWPEINGTFEPACAASRSCLLEHPEAVPERIQTGLVHVDASYVAVRQLKVKDSAGIPIVFKSKQGRARSNFLLEDVFTSHSARRVVLIGSHYQYGVVRRVEGTLFGLCEQYRYPQCQKSGWSGGIVVYGSSRAMILLENNLVYEGFGEGLNCLRSSHVVMRGNRAGNLHSNGYYLDNCSNSVVENNIGWGDLENRWASGGKFAGISVNTEHYNAPTIQDSTNNVIRNNLITGFGQCLHAAQFPGAAQRGLKVGFHAYGNSCVALQRKNLTIHKSIANVDRIIVQNNIFFSPGAIDKSCVRRANGRVTFDTNLWEGGKGFEACRSSEDVIGDPMLVGRMDEFARFDSRNQPTPRHFALRPGSPALHFGRSLTASVFDSAEMMPVARMISNRLCPMSPEALTSDFHCTTRQTPPSLGAIDRSSYAPTAPVRLK